MKDIIRKSEYTVLASFLMLSMFWGFNVYSLFQITKQDSWISIILSVIISFLPLCIYYWLLNHNPKINIIELINQAFGKFGKVVNISIILFITLLVSMTLWNLTNFISSQYLYQTPKTIIAFLFMLTSSYMVSKGLQTIGRCGTILFIINIIMFILSTLALIGKVQLKELYPILEFGMIPIFKGSTITVSFNIFPLFTLLIIPKDNIVNNKQLIKSFMKIYVVYFLVIFIVVFFTTTVLGIKLASLYQYPEYHILKTINIADFFQRVESILSTQLIFSLIMSIVIYLYYLKTAFTQNFNIKKYDNIILIIFAAIVMILSRIIFKDTTIAEYFALHIYPFASCLFLLIIPTIILIIVKIRKNA